MEESSVITFHVCLPTGVVTVSCSNFYCSPDMCRPCQCAMTHFQTFIHLYNMHGITNFCPCWMGRLLPPLVGCVVSSPCWVRRLPAGVTQGDDQARWGSRVRVHGRQLVNHNDISGKFRTTSEKSNTLFSLLSIVPLNLWHTEIHLNLQKVIKLISVKHLFISLIWPSMPASFEIWFAWYIQTFYISSRVGLLRDLVNLSLLKSISWTSLRTFGDYRQETENIFHNLYSCSSLPAQTVVARTLLIHSTV